ncbi:hypothetical protein GE061_005161 [Apolygus lucorum]|uniref:RING-type E3 ubiquitin transferase n=1 Tax=Apolygus lucorum TaxID=248454 RepID=A0A8S9WVI1_APOLU|nr:hypothetical protein GE061_005161 [Apolygus lucorum]
MASKQKEEVRENTCVVCFKEVEIFSIGQCDHPVCFECSTRMRVLCRQNECPMCRQEMPMVIFLKKIKPYESLKDGSFTLDNKYKISFFSAAEKSAYDDLLAHLCPECGKVSPNFGHLRDHVRRVHLLTYCDLCVDNLKILTKERRCYTRKDLATHRRVGDPDDRSHRGHPLCEFCDKRYMDTDELYRHLRREHLFCHFCDADGHHCYYKTYDSLREHYRNDHFLCEEGDCYMEKFTSVFRTDIDLKAHKAATHGKGLSKAGLKQARTLDIAFTLAPRPRLQRNNRYQNQGQSSGTAPREEDPEGAVGGAPEEPPPQIETPPQPVATGLNTNCIEEFPSLGGGAAPPPPPAATGGKQHKVRTASSSVRQRNQFSMDDFPALGPEGPAPPAVSTSVTMRVNTERLPSSNATPQTNLSIQVSSPRFTTTVTSKKTYNMHFPALDEGAGPPPVASTTASVQWTAKKKQSREPPTPQLSAASQLSKSKPLPQMDDFPALEPKESSKPLFPIRPPKTSTASNTIGEELFATSKSKKKKSKAKGLNANAGSVVEANSVLKKKPDDSGGLRREDFLKKKTPIESGAGEPSATNYKSAAQEKRERLYDGMVETEKATIRQADPNIRMVTAEQVMMMKGGSGKENKREQATKPVKMDDSAFPALPGFGPPPGFEAKWEAKKTSKPKAPPPGLTKAAPPPGLEGPSAPLQNTPGPPGFEPVNGSFPALQSESTTYVLPPHFERRNTTLVDKIAKALGTDALNDFKQISFAFRNSMLSPAEYYNYCKEMMGNDSFISIFPELLALLPDISKQQEIWPHYKTDKERFEASTTKGNRLDACATCGQVLRSGDLRDHLTRHSLDNHFPSLDGPKVGKNAWANK